MVGLSARRTREHDAGTEGGEKRFHRGTSRSKRSTDRPARVEPRRDNDEPRAGNARAARSAHRATRRRSVFDEPGPIEDEHDELAAIVRVRPRDDDEAITVRLGELHLAKRRPARDPPTAHGACP